MPRWMEWISDHGFPIAVIALVVVAIAFVVAKHKSLFYKE